MEGYPQHKAAAPRGIADGDIITPPGEIQFETIAAKRGAKPGAQGLQPGIGAAGQQVVVRQIKDARAKQ